MAKRRHGIPLKAKMYNGLLATWKNNDGIMAGALSISSDHTLVFSHQTKSGGKLRTGMTKSGKFRTGKVPESYDYEIALKVPALIRFLLRSLDEAELCNTIECCVSEQRKTQAKRIAAKAKSERELKRCG